jgi:hypothetical protein
MLYLDLLPDEAYQIIYKQILDKAIANTTRIARRRYLPVHGSKTNSRVIYNWLNNKQFKSLNMSTDGQKLYSYDLKIGETVGEDKHLYDYTANGIGLYSQTTSQQVNLAWRVADVVLISTPT